MARFSFSDLNKSAQPLDCFIVKLDFNVADPLDAAKSLAGITTVPDKRLLINCENLKCVRERGVSYFASVLLQIRSFGVTPVLEQVPPALERALRLLRLNEIFSITPLRPAS